MRFSYGSGVGVFACTLACALVGTGPLAGQLTVDRTNGNVSLSAPAGGAALNGYSISSPSGLLDPSTWNSLTDQSTEGWIEANPRPQQLTELNPFGSAAAGASLAIGAAYTGTTASLDAEDLSFQYMLADGSVVDGEVNYVGPINDFVLQIDPSSGTGRLELLSSNVGPFDVTGYSVHSSSGSLVPANLQSLGADWTAANPSANALAELNFTGSKLFSTGTSVSIGNIFSPSGTQDLWLEFSTVAGALLKGSVSYGASGGGGVIGDCNGDGVLNAADLGCVATIADRDAVLAAIPALPGDLDGNGEVAFADFLVLSSNFGQPLPSYTSGNIDLVDGVAFGDFLVLSANFGLSAAIAAVPEPTMGLFTMIGLTSLLGALGRKRRGTAAAVMVATAIVAAVPSTSHAQVEFDTRLVRLDAANPGSNATIDNAREARSILRGLLADVNIAEDVTATTDVIDFAGDPGTFMTNLPYPNGVANNSMDDFTVQVTGFLEIPAGDWTIGFNTDDGGVISMPRVEFIATVGENGADGTAGEIIYNGTRGFAWTLGHFTVPAGQTLRTEFEAIMFERGGGDGFEAAHLDGHVDATELSQFGSEVGDSSYGWTLLESGPSPGDFNWDDVVDFSDFLILAANFGTGSSFPQGDFNGDNRVDLRDAAGILPLLSPPAGASTSVVPEPTSASLFSLGFIGLVLSLRRRRESTI